LIYLIRAHPYSEEQIQEMMERKNRYYNELIKQITPDEVVAGGRDLLAETKPAHSHQERH
jgi:beta-phosphoglucomutase